MTQETVNNESVTLAIATRENIAMDNKGLIALAQIAKRSLHQITINVENGKVVESGDALSDNATKIWEVWGSGKQSRNGENAKFYFAFSKNEGDNGLGAYLVSVVYSQLGENAKRLAENIAKSGLHTIKSSGEVAKTLEQIRVLAYYATRFNVNIDGSPIVQSEPATAENAANEPAKGKAKK